MRGDVHLSVCLSLDGSADAVFGLDGARKGSMQERIQDFHTDKLDDLEKDMLDGCGLLIYASPCLWLQNQHAD